MDTQIDIWLAALTREEKCRLLAGATNWRTHAVERLGIPAVKMSDGPNGVRGEFVGDAGTPSVAIPVEILLGATWDPDLVEQIGDLLGREARRKAAHVLLAPGANLHRTPIGGRTFEYYSEDPELSGALAAATVRGVQAHRVAVTVKHFVANDTEVERNTVDVVVDERVLRELYLRPFEVAVRAAGAWGVMAAYNQLDGEFCAGHRRLLTDILRTEWSFDGFVVSDWLGAHDTVASAEAGLSIEMPGPARVYGPHLEAAVADGRVAEATVDALVRDLLVLIERTDAVGRPADAPEQSVDDPGERSLCRVVAAAGTVLARNVDRALPLADDASGSLAVIGPNAARTRTMGGGSSSLRALPQRSILDALAARLDGIVHEPGCAIDNYAPLPPATQLVTPDGEPGLELRFLNGTDPGAEPVLVQRTPHTDHRYLFSLPEGVSLPCIVQLRGAFVPTETGSHEVGAIATGKPSIRVGDHVLARGGEALPRGDAFFGFGSTEQVATMELRAGEPVDIDLELHLRQPVAGFRIGVRPPATGSLIERAVEAARQSTAAVVVVGTTEEWETEGADRSTISLPGEQDELVRQVAAVNGRTVVVVNAGSPVAMPWADEVAAIVIPFFGGMEMGDAVADVLLGHTDPGGRLPVTYPHLLEDAPAWAHYRPADGVQRYGEGFAIGYRGHDRLGIEPLFPFGHGLSYGEAKWGPAAPSATVLAPGESVTVTVAVSATGDRPATVVVQGYVAPVAPPVEREPKALRAWAKAVVPAGATTEVTLTFTDEAFRRWDPIDNQWVVDPGCYDLVIAASAGDIRSTVRVEIR